MRDLRKYARQTNARLVVGILSLVFVLGIGLIYLFYGPGGALTGLACLLAAFVPVALIVLVLWGMERLVDRYNRD